MIRRILASPLTLLVILCDAISDAATAVGAWAQWWREEAMGWHDDWNDDCNDDGAREAPER